jgi:hypothetical protein
MAQPKQAITEGGPMNPTRVIALNADGSVASGSVVAFMLAGLGKIQFVVAAGFPAGVTATFTPPIFGDPQTGVQAIYPNNSQNLPFGTNNQQVNMISSYMISGPGISEGPYCVTVGGAYMAIQVDSAGNMTPQQLRIPNSGLLAFNAAAAVTFDVTWTGGGDGPFGSNTLALKQGMNVVHADDQNCTVQLTAAGPVANPPGTVKIGSGGSSPLPGDE